MDRAGRLLLSRRRSRCQQTGTALLPNGQCAQPSTEKSARFWCLAPEGHRGRSGACGRSGSGTPLDGLGQGFQILGENLEEPARWALGSAAENLFGGKVRREKGLANETIVE